MSSRRQFILQLLAVTCVVPLSMYGWKKISENYEFINDWAELYFHQFPEEKNINFLIEILKINTFETFSDLEREQLKAQIVNDFNSENFVELDLFYFSRTEARLIALASMA